MEIKYLDLSTSEFKNDLNIYHEFTEQCVSVMKMKNTRAIIQVKIS